MAKPFSEFAYIPMATPPKGRPWFAVLCMDTHAKSCREKFAKECYGRTYYLASDWEMLKKEGWRIVKVKVSPA